MLTGLEWLLPAARAVKWLSDFGRDDLHEVRQEIAGLLDELWASHRADIELRLQITSVKDKEFGRNFPALYNYWQRAYFNSEDFKRTRTHCGEIRRRVDSVTFRLVRIGRTDLGKWGEIDEYFSQLMDADDVLTEKFKHRLAHVKEEMENILRMYNGSKKEALAEFKKFKTKIEAEDNANMAIVNEMERNFEKIKKTMR
jgi:hypothetical protein